jgi:hypothetical protein
MDFRSVLYSSSSLISLLFYRTSLVMFEETASHDWLHCGLSDARVKSSYIVLLISPHV